MCGRARAPFDHKGGGTRPGGTTSPPHRRGDVRQCSAARRWGGGAARVAGSGPEQLLWWRRPGKPGPLGRGAVAVVQVDDGRGCCGPAWQRHVRTGHCRRVPGVWGCVTTLRQAAPPRAGCCRRGGIAQHVSRRGRVAVMGGCGKGARSRCRHSSCQEGSGTATGTASMETGGKRGCRGGPGLLAGQAPLQGRELVGIVAADVGHQRGVSRCPQGLRRRHGAAAHARTLAVPAGTQIFRTMTAPCQPPAAA